MSRFSQAFFMKGLCLLGLLMLTVCNLRLYAPPPDQNEFVKIGRTLDHFKTQLDGGLATDMQRLFPEGYFFSYVLYGLARTNLAQQSIDVEANLGEAIFAYEMLKSGAGIAPFSAELTPAYGIFYQGWHTYLLANIVATQTIHHPPLQAEFALKADSIARALDSAEMPFLPAYPHAAWPVDTVVAVAALQQYADLNQGRHQATIDAWLAQTIPFRDETVGLLPHRVHAMTGAALDGPRATSQSLIIRFWSALDKIQAKNDYATFTTHFLTDYAGLSGLLEYPRGVDGGWGDVDSGPLIGGVSLSATAVMLGTARALCDGDLGLRLWQSAEFVGLPLEFGGQRRYVTASPFKIGNVFAAWSASTPLGCVGNGEAPAQAAETNWRSTIHLISVLCATLVVLPLRPKQFLRERLPTCSLLG